MKLVVGSSETVSTLMGAGLCRCAEDLSDLMIDLADNPFASTMSSFSRNYRSIDQVFDVKWTSAHLLVSCLVSVLQSSEKTSILHLQ